MDFDEHDDGDEEMAPMPVSSSYEAPPLAAVAAGGFGGGVAAPPKPTGEPGSGRAKAPSSGLHGGAGGRYRECLKNHAVGIGGHAVDGCGEFMPAGEEGTLDALRCAACNCHRNFHRKESPTAAEGGSPISPAALVAYGGTPQHHFSPYYRTPAGGGYFHHHHHQPPPLHHMGAHHTPRPLALPSTSPHSGRDDGDDLSAGMMSAGPLSAMGAPLTLSGMSLGGAGPSGSGGSGGSGKKRFRTKFSQDQKDRMLAFAERVGWRIQKHDEAAVQQFCDEVGVKRHVLKVWMHNNKHTLGKKP